MWRPVRSASRAGSTSGGRAARVGRADRVARRRPRRRPRRWPAARPAARRRTGPDASSPGLGLDDRVAEVVAQPRDVGPRRRVRPHVAVHRRRDDDRRGRREAPWRSRRRRPARWPWRRASARWPGRRRSRRRVSATTMWPIRPSGSSSRTSVSTGWRDRAANVSGPTNRVAAGREHHDDVGALGAQEPEQLDGLVRGDRAGDAERDEPSVETRRSVTAARAPAARRRRPRRGGSRGP